MYYLLNQKTLCVCRLLSFLLCQLCLCFSVNGDIRDRLCQWCREPGPCQPTAPRGEFKDHSVCVCVWLLVSHSDRKLMCFLLIQAYHGHCAALEVLLSSLLEVDICSPEGRTPLSLACSRGHQECVSLLLHHGSSPMTRDYTHKKTAIHAAGS